MNKNDLKKLALLGLAGGMIISQNVYADDKNDKKLTQVNQGKVDYKNKSLDDIINDVSSGNLQYHLMSEEELLEELDANGKRIYDSLTPEGKKLAIDTASNICSGNNKCKGLNACKSDKNECAGQGSCKGQSRCAITDKNLAVQLAAQRMEEKRNEANGSK